MGDLRNKNAQNWATATSLIPIFGNHISQGILQRNLSRQQKEAADKLNPVDEVYQTSEFAKEQLANARNAVNARMPGSLQAENNLYRNQANTMMNLARVGSPQQMIAGAGAVQMNTNNALTDLATQEQQYRTGMMSNLNNALGVMTNEGDKIYQDRTNRFNRLNNEKQGLLNSSQQNFSNSIQSASNAMSAGVDTALQLFGGGMMGQKKPIKPTGAVQPIGNFNPAAGWFQMPGQANYNPSIYGRP